MTTTLYLIRHGATAANLATPARLQGRRTDPPLAPLGIQQAEAARHVLAGCRFAACYSSPLQRAFQTATLVAAPHGLIPQPLAGLTECDVGAWEGLDWDTIRTREPDAYRQFHAAPGEFGYPDGESFGDVARRVTPVLEELLVRHDGAAFLVVGHHVVNRVYLAGLLGLTPNQARRIALDNCGISVVNRSGDKTRVATLNAAFHLDGLAA